MQCPRCKGNNVIIDRELAGSTTKTNYMRTGIKHSWFLPAGKKTQQRNVNYRTVALCKDCGNTWNVASQSDMISGAVTVVIIILIVILLIFSSKNKKDENNQTVEKSTPTEQTDPTVINTEENIDTSIWSSEYTSIEDFEWSVDENGILLKNYKVNGSGSRVRLSDEYTINGASYHIYKLDGCFFCDSMKSIIVPEGVTEIVDYTFNSCGVEYLYLPASLESFGGWNYLSDLKTIYYGGSEEQWNERFKTKDYLKNASIEYNINPNDLK